MTTTGNLWYIRRAYDPIDLSSRAFWSTTAAERERSFAELRAERPVSWHPPVEDALMPDPDDRGYWAVTRRVGHRHGQPQQRSVRVRPGSDVREHPRGAARSVAVVPGDGPAAAHQAAQARSAPRSRRGRSAASRNRSKANAKTIVEELHAAGSGADFVDHCAKELPIRTLSDMVGIPDSERERMAHATDARCRGPTRFPQRPQPAGGSVREPDVPAPGRRRRWPRSAASTPAMT